MSADFQRALMQEVMTTELLRIKALIATTAVLCVILGAVHFFASEAVSRVWHGNLRPEYLYSIMVRSSCSSCGCMARSTASYAAGARPAAVIRRYLGALIETSLPTVALALHINSMGSVAALGFATPMIYFIFIILSTLRLDFWLSTFTGAVAAVELFCMAMFYHPAVGGNAEPLYYHAARSLIVLVCGVLAGAVGHQLRRQFEASIKAATARDRITNLFGQHVSPQVVERLMAEGTTTGSDIRRVAVMFVDFRSFTAGARTRTPQEVVDRLDGAFAILVDILDRHGGIVNKFLGDGFLALFGAPLEAPDPAHRAVAAAREMLEANARANEGANWPLRIGIGIHLGEVVAGNIGSPRRKEYTVIGDTVNFASRLEALNKDFNSQFLISEAVRDAVGEACSDAVSLGEVEVRGYERPMAVWRLG